MAGLMDTMNVAALWWAAGMKTVLLESAVLAVVAFAFSRGLRGASSALRFWLWMLVPLRLLAMPLPEIPAPILPVSVVARPAIETAAFAGTLPPVEAMDDDAATRFGKERVAEQVEQTASVPSPLVRASHVRAEVIWFALWLAGVSLFAGRLAMASREMRHVRAQARPATDPRLTGLARQAADIVGLRSVPPILVAEKDVAPFVMGVRRPAVVLSSRFLSAVTEGQLLAVLAHEYAHVRRRDTVWGLILGVCEVGFFFNPFFHWAKRCALIEREKACDSWVLAARGANRGGYARAILTAAELGGCGRPFAPAHAPAESFGALRQRLVAISVRRVSKPRLAVGEAIALALLAIVCIPGIALTERSVAQTPATDTAPVMQETRRAAAPADTQIPAASLDAAPSPAKAPSPTTASDTTSPNPQPPDLRASRTLIFPRDRSVGRISVRDANKKRAIETYYYWIDGCEWEELGEATGRVAIPDGKLVRLELRPDGSQDWSWLSGLPDDALYNVTVLPSKSRSSLQPAEAPIGDSMTRSLSGLASLHELSLQHSNVTEQGLASLAAYTKLERLWTPPGLTDAGMAYIAALPSLTALYIHKPIELTETGLKRMEGIKRIKELALNGSDLDDTALAHLRGMRQLDYLELAHDIHFGDNAMAYLKDVPSLRILNVGGCGVSNRGLKDISGLPNLERLALYHIQVIGDQGLSYLSTMPRLRMLDFMNATRVTDQGLASLAHGPALESLSLPLSITNVGLGHVAKIKSLRYLWAGGGDGGPFTDEGLALISSLKDLDYLLVAGGDGITDRGLEHLSGLQRLNSLNILTRSKHITDAGIAHLARLRELSSLHINFTDKSAKVTVAGINELNVLPKIEFMWITGVKKGTAVLDLSNLKKLDKLCLECDGMTDEDVACLSGLTQLRWLQGVKGITDEGIAHLAGLTNLDRLTISKSPGVTDAGLRYVGNMRRMTVLTLRDCGFTEDGLRNIENLRALSVLDVSSSQPINPAAYDRLRDILPNLNWVNERGAGFAGGTPGATGSATRRKGRT